jgi:uncharacterized protein (TIGR03083 family)
MEGGVSVVCRSSWAAYRALMDTAVYLTNLEHHALLLSDSARSVGLDAPVPTCPEWTIEDLVAHTSQVHRHKTEIVLGRYVEESPPFPPPPTEVDVLAWYNDGVNEMLGVFGDADLSLPIYTWCNHEHSADWWVRRMAHETVIHGADAVIAAGGTPRIDAALAEDGVDEVLDEFMTGSPPWVTVAPGGRRIDLLAGDRRWSLRTATFSGVSPDSGAVYEALDTVVFDDVGDPDAVVRAEPETLNLWLWGRGSLDDGAASGDADLIRHLRTVAAESTQ